MWTVCEKEVRPREPIYEHESKMIHSLNALCLVCCAYNQRTVLIVTQDDWQVMIMYLKSEEMKKIHISDECACSTHGLVLRTN